MVTYAEAEPEAEPEADPEAEPEALAEAEAEADGLYLYLIPSFRSKSIVKHFTSELFGSKINLVFFLQPMH